MTYLEKYKVDLMLAIFVVYILTIMWRIII